MPETLGMTEGSFPSLRSNIQMEYFSRYEQALVMYSTGTSCVKRFGLAPDFAIDDCCSHDVGSSARDNR